MKRGVGDSPYQQYAESMTPIESPTYAEPNYTKKSKNWSFSIAMPLLGTGRSD